MVFFLTTPQFFEFHFQGFVVYILELSSHLCYVIHVGGCDGMKLYLSFDVF